MTEFEEKVAAALTEALNESTAEILSWEPPPGYAGERHTWPAYLAAELAPRVAAAIEAGLTKQKPLPRSRYLTEPAGARRRRAALRALRGEASP